MSTQKNTMVDAEGTSHLDRRAEVKKGGKFLTFFLSEEEYGLEILRVSEIIGMMAITPIPRTESYVRGVINLRGKVIPVVDLRLKLGMESRQATVETCIIVVQVQGTPMGITVDKVSEVADIEGSQIEDPPNFGGAVDTDFILGLGKSTEGRVKLLLDIDQVLSSHGMVDFQSIVNQEMGEPVGA